MRRHIHRHPLQSFRFWFLLLAAVALVTAWKLDLFGNRRTRNAELVVETLPTSEDGEAGSEEMIADAFGEQGEPAPEPTAGEAGPASADSAGAVSPYRSSERADAAANQRPVVSPFGPANPEFVAAPQIESEPAGEDGLVRTAMAEEPVNPLAKTTRREMQKTKSRVIPASNAQTAELSATRVAPATGEEAAAADSQAAGIDLAEIDRLIEAGDDVGAHRLMSRWYWKSPQARPQFQERLETLAKRIYMQPQVHYLAPYVVQNGDVLQAIAKGQNVSWQYLAKLNRTDPKKIRPGQKLKVIKGPFSAVVDLSDFELTVHAHGYFVKRYAIGVGKDESTPIGTFKIEEKLTDPTYYGPDMVIEHDDPANPLGEYWLGIGNSFGIHGTIEPDSVGKAESQGCVRMRDADVAEVYDFLTTGSEVVIRR